MPRYFFDISDHVFIKDEIGSEVDNNASMRTKAVKVAAEAVEAEAATGGDPNSIKVIVRNEADRRVLTALPIQPRERS